MYDNLMGRKLLVIGSDETTANIVETARSLGVYVVAADGRKTSVSTPAKNLADEAWDMDYSHVEEIGKRCREEKIDGVLAGYSEFRVLAACRIAEYIGTPFYATREQIDLTRDKRSFKDACKQYGIPIPEDFSYTYPLTEAEIRAVRYPVIVKPADYGGRKGISVCMDREELEKGLQLAKSLSQAGKVIVEEYILGTEISAVYTLSKGEISLSCFNEKYINEENGRRNGLCDLTVTPSNYYDMYLRTTDGKIRAFLQGIGAKAGVAFFQGIAREDGIYIFEMGYRLNGNNDYQAAEKYNGISYMKMLISHSLCGDMGDDLGKDDPLFPEYNCTFKLYAHAGTIGRLLYGGPEEIPGIDSVHVCAGPGCTIVEDGSTQQMVLSYKLSAKTIDQVRQIIDSIQDSVAVDDTEGKNMLFGRFDTNRMKL